MKDLNKTKEQLVAELSVLRERITELERPQSKGVDTRESLRESEMRYRFITENVGDFIWQLDSGFCFTYVSPSVRRIGIEPEEMIGKPLFSFLTPEGIEITKQLYARRLVLMESGTPEDKTMVELDFVLKDGSLLPVEVRVSPYIDEKGHLVSFQGVTRDISQRKFAQEEKARLESRLLGAQKMEAIGQLAGGVAHDFNNALMVIIGFASIMKTRMNQSDPLKKYVDQILSSSQKAANLTKSLLAFSRRQQMNLTTIDVSDIVRNAEESLKEMLTDNIKFELQLSNCECVIMADSNQMSQVLIDLVANAIDAMPHGGLLRIETGTTRIDSDSSADHGFARPGEYAFVAVADSGTGMDAMTQEHIFEPFFTTKAGKGTGLGLSTAYGIVKQHDGSITVESSPGKGTVFRMFLPLAATRRENKALSQEVSEKGRETPSISGDAPAL